MRRLIPGFLLLAVAVFPVRGQNLAGPIDPVARYNGYAGGTIGLSALSGACITVNLIRLNGTDRHREDAILGIVVGAAQTTYGIINANSPEPYAEVLTPVNIGVGMASVVTSILRLVKRPVDGENRLTLSLTCLRPCPQYPPAPGLRLCRAIR